MAKYDFLILQPNEFENLTRDLLQKREGVFIESFTIGRDGGIDLRFSSPKGKGELHDDYSAWLTSESPNVIMFPRSIRKILLWMKEHNNEMSLEKMSEDLGYTQEELMVMLDYFVKQADVIEAKKKKYLEDGQMFDELLEMDKSVFHN